MDFKRYLLIGAVAVLSYMLLIEWSQFRTEHKAPVANIQQTEAAPADNADALIPNEPSPQENFPSGTAEQKAVATVELNQDTILVTTDALKLEINPVGGDITAVALPKHFAAIDTPDVPFVLMEQNTERTYIAQSGLVGKNGTDTNKGRPLFNSVSRQYQMANGQDQLIVDLHLMTDQQVSITKRFTFTRGEYVISVDYLIDNTSTESWSAGMFGQLKRDSSSDPGTDSGGMGLSPYLGAAFTQIEEPYNKVSFDDMAEAPYKDSRQGGWAAIIQHYFLTAWIPDVETNNSFSSVKTADGLNLVRFTGPAIEVASGQQGEIKSQFYAGPKDQYRLEEISPGLELSVDYGFLWLPAQG
ncbi:MAG: YidC/Oxa1 family membrane protein insertase, partial [Pseudohongiellaceae bacterium]